MSDSQPGSGRLLLLGGLSALALDDRTRRRVVGGTRDLIGTAQDTLDDRVKPALLGAATGAQEVAQTALERGAETLGTLREEVPTRAGALASTAQEAAEGAAKVAAAKAAETAARAADLTRDLRREAAHGLESLGETVQEFTEDRRKDAGEMTRRARKQAERQIRQARRLGQAALAGTEAKGKALLRPARRDVEDHRRDAERVLNRARRTAERELRASRENWTQARIERAVEKKISPLRKQTLRDLAQIERQKKRADRQGERASGGLGGGLVVLGLLGVGAVVLARVPTARQAVLDAVGRVNPEAEQGLRRAGRNARNLVGTMWIERIEEPGSAPAPAAAPATQAATTGATWGGSPAAGSSAASGTGQAPTQTPGGQTSGDKSN